MSWVSVTTTIWRAQICRLKLNISITCSIKNKLLEWDRSVYPTAITKLSDYTWIHQIIKGGNVYSTVGITKYRLSPFTACLTDTRKAVSLHWQFTWNVSVKLFSFSQCDNSIGQVNSAFHPSSVAEDKAGCVHLCQVVLYGDIPQRWGEVPWRTPYFLISKQILFSNIKSTPPWKIVFCQTHQI